METNPNFLRNAIIALVLGAVLAFGIWFLFFRKVDIEEETTLNNGKEAEPIAPPDYTCQTKYDCALKLEPYCCGKTIQSVNSCFHKNEEIYKLGEGACEGEDCPSRKSATSCQCYENECVNIYEDLPPDPKSACMERSDCTWIFATCSGCECGIPINKEFKAELELEWLEECKDYTGPSCEYCCPFTLKCIDNQCTPVSLPGSCI